MLGNHKSALPKREQGSIQQAGPVQMLRTAIWEAFKKGMPALLLHRKAKAVFDWLVARISSNDPPHRSEPAAGKGGRTFCRDQRGWFAMVTFFRVRLGGYGVGTGSATLPAWEVSPLPGPWKPLVRETEEGMKMK